MRLLLLIMIKQGFREKYNVRLKHEAVDKEVDKVLVVDEAATVLKQLEFDFKRNLKNLKKIHFMYKIRSSITFPTNNLLHTMLRQFHNNCICYSMHYLDTILQHHNHMFAHMFARLQGNLLQLKMYN